jgi:Protein kinase domain
MPAAAPAAAEGAGAAVPHRQDAGKVLALGRGAVLDAGGDQSCTVTTAGTARCWGDNGAGQASPPAGLGTTPRSPSAATDKPWAGDLNEGTRRCANGSCIMRYEQFVLADPVFYEAPTRSPLAEHVFGGDLPLPGQWHREYMDVWTVLVRAGATMPPQGWKIHVSATVDTANDVVRAVWDYCVPRDIPFKHLTDHSGFLVRNTKYAARGISGKFVTIYPANTDQAEKTLKELDAELAGWPGPYILSDVRWRAGPLYVRYGAFIERYCPGTDGEPVPAISTPDGRLVPDRRLPDFVVPDWVEIPEFLAPSVAARRSPDPPHEFPYRIIHPLHFSNGGGVYLAEDLDSGHQVVLKEARPFAGLDMRGHDAVQRLEHERRLLERLIGTSTVPEPIGSFTCWEHRFLAEEYIEGEPLITAMVRRFPLIQASAGEEEVRGYTHWALKTLDTVSRALHALHEHGVALGDLHPRNILLRPDGQVRFVDLEVASGVEDDVPPVIGLPGYVSPDGRTGVEADRYALACLYLSFFLPLTALLPLDPAKAGVLVRAAGERFDIPEPVVESMARTLYDRRLPSSAAHPPARPNGEVRGAGDEHVAALAVALGSGKADWPTLRMSLRDAIVASATPERTDRLFPGDIDQFTYGGLDLATGAAGVLHALARSGAGRFPEYERWLLDGVRDGRRIKRAGFYDGLHGVAYALAELGRHDDALAVLDRAMAMPLDRLAPGLFGGLAGVGLNLLHFAALTGSESLRSQALTAAERLTAWRHDGHRTGLMYGPSGQALLYIRLFEATGEPAFLDHAETALRLDLARCADRPDGSLQVDEGWRMMPYIATGSVGIGMVLHEYLRHRENPQFTSALARIRLAAWPEFVIGSGLFNGRAGFIAFLTMFRDGDRVPLELHLHRLAWHVIPYRGHVAFPGDQLMRLSMDLATGSAGVLTALSAVYEDTPVLPFFPRTPIERNRHDPHSGTAVAHL